MQISLTFNENKHPLYKGTAENILTEHGVDRFTSIENGDIFVLKVDGVDEKTAEAVQSSTNKINAGINEPSHRIEFSCKTKDLEQPTYQVG